MFFLQKMSQKKSQSAQKIRLILLKKGFFFMRKRITAFYKKSLFERFFTLFYQREIVSEDGFSAWADDDDDTVPGRVDAVVQTTAFLRVITEVIEDDEEGEEGEEEEEDEIDAPRETA